MPTRRWRSFAWQRMRPRDLFGVAVFWLVLALAAAWGWLAPFDGRLFDLAVRAWPADPPARVAILRLPSTPPAGQAERLRRLRASHVLDLGPGELTRMQRADRFATAEAAACRPPAPDGVLRALPLRDGAGPACPLGRLAASAGLTLPGSDLVFPDYSARTSTSIPQLDLATAPGEAGLRAAVAGRIVLRVQGPDVPTFVTPLYAADGLLEPSVPYAMALDALARGRAIREAPPGVDVLAAMLATLLLHLALRRSTYRRTLVVTLLASLPMLLALALVLHLGRVHVPMAASLVAIAAYALRTVLQRNRALGETLVDVDHRLTGLVGQPLGQGFELATDLVWEHANRFVTGFFDLRRSLMLELPAGATHMRPVAAFGCEAADIIEKRRDYRRAPFSTALARELPTPPSRPFLPAEDGVVDLITPLIAADQLVGFWALSVVAAPDGDLDALAVEAGRYAGEVAKVILRSAAPGDASDPGARRWPSLARLRARLLDGANQAREQLAAYRDVFGAVGHPIAVCDLLGRVQFANPAFEELAEALSQPLMAMSATRMLEQMCGLGPAAAKGVLRHVILGTGAEARLPMPAPNARAPQAFVLRPILRRSPDAEAGGASPFDLLGIVVEVVPDARGIEAATRLGRAAVQYARRSQAVFDRIASRVDALAPDERLADIVAAGLDEARTLLRQAEALPVQDEAGDHRLDLAAVLQRVRLAHARVSREKNVDVPMPAEPVPDVAAAEAPVARLLHELVALLLDDAAPGSGLGIRCTMPDAATVELAIRNDGYGMPAWHVRDVLREAPRGPLRADASPLDRVAHAAAALEASTGFRLEAELGSGYRASLTLPRAP